MAENMTLMPCPFCGAPAAKNRNSGDRWVYYCPNGHTGYLRHKEWQARSHLAQPAQAVDVGALRETLFRIAADNHKSALTLGQEGLRGQCIQTSKELHEITRAIGNAHDTK